MATWESHTKSGILFADCIYFMSFSSPASSKPCRFSQSFTFDDFIITWADCSGMLQWINFIVTCCVRSRWKWEGTSVWLLQPCLPRFFARLFVELCHIRIISCFILTLISAKSFDKSLMLQQLVIYQRPIQLLNSEEKQTLKIFYFFRTNPKHLQTRKFQFASKR